jgi:hypothetical protein
VGEEKEKRGSVNLKGILVQKWPVAVDCVLKESCI